MNQRATLPANDLTTRGRDPHDPRTALAVEQGCVLHAVNRLARLLGRRYDAALRPAGLTGGQFALLAALTGLGPCPRSALAERLGMDRTTLTRNLAPLLRDGLAEGVADPDDRRVRAVGLTPAGRSLWAAALPLWQAVTDETRARLGPALPALHGGADRVA